MRHLNRALKVLFFSDRVKRMAPRGNHNELSPSTLRFWVVIYAPWGDACLLNQNNTLQLQLHDAITFTYSDIWLGKPIKAPSWRSMALCRITV